MPIDRKVTTLVTREVTRRSFFRRMAGWGVVAGFGLSGVSSLLTRRPAWAITCSQADDPSAALCSCSTCGVGWCDGCNGSEFSDGCPPGYNPDYLCMYDTTGCWCTKNCCVMRRDGTRQRRRRMCCDCQKATDASSKCTCRGAMQWGATCSETDWILDGRITEGDLVDNLLNG
jgi:hypothetical protein